MNLMDDAYYRMIESKLADALSNLTYYEKEYKQALGKCQVITKQLDEYKKLVGGIKDDGSTLEGTST